MFTDVSKVTEKALDKAERKNIKILEHFASKSLEQMEKGVEEIRFTPEIKSILDAEKTFLELPGLYNWCQDLKIELSIAGRKDPAFYEKRIEYCREFCSLFPETGKLFIENVKRAEAESYFALDLVEKGEEAFRALVEEFPDSAWVYIGWVDMYWLFRESKAPRDYDKAEEIYRLALERGVADRDDALERLRDLEEERKNKKGVTS